MTVGTISDLGQRLRGRVIDPDDPTYDAARALYNGMIDKRPRLIAQCVDAADVIACVGYAREAGLDVAIRGGGHNGPGLGSVDDGLVIDLSPMRGRPGRPRARNRARRRRLHLRRRRSRHARLRPRRALRHRLDHRRRRTDPRRRHRVPHAPARPDHRQPARGRRRPRRRSASSPPARPATPICSGRCAAAAATSAWSPASCSRPTRSARSTPARSSGTPRHIGQRDARLSRLPRRGARGARQLRRASRRCPPIDPFPEEHLGQARLRGHLLLQRPGRRGAEVMAPLLDQLPEPLFNWMERDAVPGHAGAVRPVLPPRACSGTGRATSSTSSPTRRSRSTSRRAGECAERAVADAPLPDRRRRPPRRADRDGVERARVPPGRWSSPPSTRTRPRPRP